MANQFSLNGATPGLTYDKPKTPTTNGLIGNGTTPNLNFTTSSIPMPKIGTNTGLLNQPSTAVKSVTSADGTKTEYHKPDTQKSTYDGAADVAKFNSNQPTIVSGPGSPNYTQQDAPKDPTTPTPPTYAPTTDLQGKIISGLANMSQQPSQAYNDAQAEAAIIVQAQTDLAKNYAEKTNNIAGTAGFLTQQTGLQGQLNNQYNTANAALSSQYQGATNRLGAANTQQGLLQGALQQAGSLNAPQFPSYGSQVYNPSTGFINSGTSLNDAVSGVVQKLQSGQMTYDQATQALSGYGQGGINALQQALPQGYNISQSSSLAQQQGTIKPAYDYAKTALTNLQSAVSNLAVGQSTNIPIINSIGQGISTTFGLGSQGVQAYRAAIAEARSAVQKVLASVSGGTPTDYVGQSEALLPNNATPNQIKAAIETLDTLGQAKVGIYGNPGTAGTKPNTTIKTSAGEVNPNF